MKRMMLRVAGLMVLFGALSVATAHADSRFSIHVGVGGPVAVAPGPYGYDGYYVGYRWVGGGWVPRARFVERRWDRRDFRRNWERDRRDWERSRGNWQRDHRRR